MSGWTVCFPRCRTKACRRALAPQNRSGWCWQCADKSGRCAECWRPCNRKAKRCDKCHLARAKDRARTVGPCSAVGCDRHTKSRCGLCRWHRDTHKPCSVEGCEARVGYYSETGLCRPHRIQAYEAARKPKRKAKRDKERAKLWRARGAKGSKRGRSAARRGATASSGQTTARGSARATTSPADSASDASDRADSTERSAASAE